MSGPLSYTEAMRPPCDGCAAYCCRYLALPEFRVETFDDLDWVVYLSNFDRIHLTLTESGRWFPYYGEPCRHLDLGTNRCKVHGTPTQPHTCVRYNPFSCHYRGVFSTGAEEGQLWIDRRRLARLLTGVEVEDLSRAVTLPRFDVLRAAFEAMPVEATASGAQSAPVPVPEPRRRRRGAPAAAAAPQPGTPTTRVPTVLRFDDAGVRYPCDGCAAYCCTTLVVPIDPPSDATLLDYLRYALGYPSVEVVVAGESWSLAIPTTCRHLSGSRCSAFGREDRPVRCQFYDAWTCTYRDTFAPERSGGLRLRYEDFPALQALLGFDDRGRALAVPTEADLRAALANVG